MPSCTTVTCTTAVHTHWILMRTQATPWRGTICVKTTARRVSNPSELLHSMIMVGCLHRFFSLSMRVGVVARKEYSSKRLRSRTESSTIRVDATATASEYMQTPLGLSQTTFSSTTGSTTTATMGLQLEVMATPRTRCRLRIHSPAISSRITS